MLKERQMTHFLARKVLALILAGHVSAAVDAFTTRSFIARHSNDPRPAFEMDPLLKPFANGPGLYFAVQAGPILSDLALLKAKRHPKAAITLALAVTVLHSASAAHNIAHQQHIEARWHAAR